MALIGFSCSRLGHGFRDFGIVIAELIANSHSRLFESNL